MKEACLIRADFQLADLREAHLLSADVSHALISRADLSGATLNGIDARGASFKMSNLKGAYVRFAKFDGATTLYGAYHDDRSFFTSTNWWDADFSKPEGISIDADAEGRTLAFRTYLERFLPEPTLTETPDVPSENNDAQQSDT